MKPNGAASVFHALAPGFKERAPVSGFSAQVGLLLTLFFLPGNGTRSQFNFSGDLCISGSIDRTCKVWDVASGQCIHTLRGHNDEILDVSFNTTGSKLVSASADGTSRVFNTMTGACQVRFTPQ